MAYQLNSVAKLHFLQYQAIVLRKKESKQVENYIKLY